MELSIADLHAFMLDLRGPLSVVVETDPFWHNRLLLELDCDAEDELKNERYACCCICNSSLSIQETYAFPASCHRTLF